MRITEFSTANLRFILGSKSGWGTLRRLSQLKLLLTHPKAGSIELLQSSLLRFTQCDPDVSTLLSTGAFDQVYQARERRTNRRVGIKVLIVDGMLDPKRRKKKQEGMRGDWFVKGTSMNDGRITSPSASLRSHMDMLEVEM